MAKIKTRDVATNTSTSEPITLGCLCRVFVFLEIGYTLLLLPTSIPQNTDCSKPKVTHLFGSLHNSEKPGWSPWDSNALDWVSCRHCEHSTPARAGHLCSTQILRAMMLCTPILGPKQSVKLGHGEQLCDGHLQRCRTRPLLLMPGQDPAEMCSQSTRSTTFRNKFYSLPHKQVWLRNDLLLSAWLA